MGLPGKSKTVIVEPLEQPVTTPQREAEPATVPARQPDRELTPA